MGSTTDSNNVPKTQARRTCLTIEDLLNPLPVSLNPSPHPAYSSRYTSGTPVSSEDEKGNRLASPTPSSVSDTVSEEDERDDGLFTKDGRCQRCMKVVLYKNWADHRKIHLLQGTLGAEVPVQKRCTNCAVRGHQCIVAKQPWIKELNTLRCLRCIKNKEGCSFTQTPRHLRYLRHHPARQE